MAKVRIGHFAEAQRARSNLGVDFIDESEVLTPADAEQYHVPSTPSGCPSFAARATWAKPCGASARARR